MGRAGDGAESIMSNDNEETIFLVTSDIYKKDILNMLCLEKGMKYRFRYRYEWVPQELLEDTTRLTGEKGIITFFDATTRKFFPIFGIIINEVEPLGDVLYFEFTLNGLVKYKDRDCQINEHDSKIKKDINGDYFESKTGTLKKYVFSIKTESFETDCGNDLSSWISILNKIWNLEPFRNSIFLRILEITDSKGNLIRPSEVNSQTKEKGYILKSHEAHKLAIFQRARNDFPSFNSFRINLFFVKDHITPIKESDIIVGKYDKLQLALLTKWRKSDVISVIGLKAQPNESVELPEVYIPVKIPLDKNRLLASISTSSLGIVTAISAGYVPQIFSMPPTIISPILSVLGAVLFALGVAWLRPMYE